jgi:hypothetical protein
MADGIGKKEYLEEYFTTACILCGKIQYLEEIKRYIIKTYVEKGVLKMIRPTYSKQSLSVVTESDYHLYEKQNSTGECGDFFLTFVLRGEVTYTEQVKEYIGTYVEKGLVSLEKTPYSKEKQFIVGQ